MTLKIVHDGVVEVSMSQHFLGSAQIQTISRIAPVDLYIIQSFLADSTTFFDNVPSLLYHSFKKIEI